MQLAFANEETSKLLVSTSKGSSLISTVAAQIKKFDSADRVKETLFQLLNNIATNYWSVHEEIIEADVISHAMASLRSVRAAESLKRAAVNFVYSLSFSPAGRGALLDSDVVGALIPIIKVNKATLNSMCATLAISNLVGARQRSPMLAGCGVPEKVRMRTMAHRTEILSPERPAALRASLSRPIVPPARAIPRIFALRPRRSAPGPSSEYGSSRPPRLSLFGRSTQTALSFFIPPSPSLCPFPPNRSSTRIPLPHPHLARAPPRRRRRRR